MKIKYFFTYLLLLTSTLLASGQSNNNILAKHNLSPVWLKTENRFVYGFIGDNYQRIRIKFIRVTKSKKDANIYEVYGKSMVKNNIDEFNGILTIHNIKKLQEVNAGVDDENKAKGIKGEYTITGDYLFSEGKDQPHAGIFKGTFVTSFYINKNNKPQYDDLEMSADGFANNEFTGQWIDHTTQKAKKCNWGDYRVPSSGNFDGGAGEFSPDDKYLNNGWQSVRDAYTESDKGKSALQIENRKWWE